MPVTRLTRGIDCRVKSLISPVMQDDSIEEETRESELAEFKGKLSVQVLVNGKFVFALVI